MDHVTSLFPLIYSRRSQWKMPEAQVARGRTNPVGEKINLTRDVIERQTLFHVIYCGGGIYDHKIFFIF